MMTPFFRFEKRLAKFLHRLNPQETLHGDSVWKTGLPANGANERETGSFTMIPPAIQIRAHSRDSRAKHSLHFSC